MNSSEINKKGVICAYKEIGETPLEVIARIRSDDPSLKDSTITYAGRLDPMAEGLLLLLVDDEVSKKDDYLALDKEYEFQVLFGFSTDSYDILGRITESEDVRIHSRECEKILDAFKGKQKQMYPPYSSKTVEGKPLFKWARESRLHEITLPTHEIEIKQVELIEMEQISSDDLKAEISRRIGRVKGDFRQRETIELWRAYIENASQKMYKLAVCTMSCSSGTYVRALVHDLGERLGISATTFSIKRTRVGEYTSQG